MFTRGGNVAPSTMAAEILDRMSWLIGPWPMTATSFLQPIVIILFTAIVFSLIVSAIAALTIRNHATTSS